MALPDESIRVDITRADAHALIEQLINDDEMRAEFESNPHQVLERHGISVPEAAIPEDVKLPPKEDLEEFLTLLDEKVAPEGTSSLGFALIIIAFGAMPVQIGGRSAGDGTG